MATLSDLATYVMVYVPACPLMFVEQQLRDVCRDFCAHAAIVQVEIDPIDVVAGQSDYDIDVPFGTDVTMILSATYQGATLAERGQYRGLTLGEANSFTLDQAPAASAPGAIAMRVATKPSRSANTVADILLNDYGYEIGQGAVGRLLMIPGQPWSAPASAAAYTATYQHARTNARIAADASFGAATARVRPRRFG